jgi:hypothetical protein
MRFSFLYEPYQRKLKKGAEIYFIYASTKARKEGKEVAGLLSTPLNSSLKE